MFWAQLSVFEIRALLTLLFSCCHANVNGYRDACTWQRSFRSCHQKGSSKKKFSFYFLLFIRDCLKWLWLVFTRLLYASIIAEQYPKLVNGPPPERRRVGKDKKQICDKRERERGRESSRKKGIKNNGLRKQFQTSHTIFFFTHLMRR